jgi:glycosyltransferase involved in cell wall biosynthesis
MGRAKPIVPSDLEQLGEVIADGESGVLCPPGDPEAAAEAVVRLLGDPPLRARWARRRSSGRRRPTPGERTRRGSSTRFAPAAPGPWPAQRRRPTSLWFP